MTIADNWWHLAQTPTGFHAHHVDPEELGELVEADRAADPEVSEQAAVADALGDLAEAIRRSLDFPPRNRWHDRDGWYSSITQGEPHPKYLEKATIHKGRILPEGG